MVLIMNNKQYIGLVTLFRNNYGSFLQCYALKESIEKLNFICTVLEEKKEGKHACFEKMADKLLIIWRSLIYRGYLTKKIKMKKAMLIEQSLLSEASREKINKLIKSEIMPIQANWKQLLYIGQSDDYKAFIVGSDQVWNASRNINPIFFLRFAPLNKRLTYAVSFGVSEVPNWNKRCLERGLRSFSSISIRENNATIILENLCKNYSIECDPALLMSPKEWRRFYEPAKAVYSQYLFAHFINEPNECAIETIKFLSSELDLKVICFGYKHSSITALPNSFFIDGDPRDYVEMIDNSAFVCTDSFHTSLFCINLSKNFYVFERQYLHGQPQTGRITDLLTRYGLQDRLCNNIDGVSCTSIDFFCNEKVKEDREKGIRYLTNILS